MYLFILLCFTAGTHGVQAGLELFSLLHSDPGGISTHYPIGSNVLTNRS